MVRSQRQCVVLPLLPELEEGRGEQGQRTGLTFDVVDEHVGQLRLHLQANTACGQLDGTPELRGLHRPDEHMVRAQQPGQPGIGGEASVEVGSQRDDDDRSTLRISGRANERVDEGHALAVGATCGEQLLELVDGEEEPPVRRQRVECLGERIPRSRHEHATQLVQRPLAGSQQQASPAAAARQHSSGEGGEKTGAEDRRLSAA